MILRKRPGSAFPREMKAGGALTRFSRIAAVNHAAAWALVGIPQDFISCTLSQCLLFPFIGSWVLPIRGDPWIPAFVGMTKKPETRQNWAGHKPKYETKLGTIKTGNDTNSDSLSFPRKRESSNAYKTIDGMDLSRPQMNGVGKPRLSKPL